MSRKSTRRNFLQTTAAGGALLGLGDLAFLSCLPPVSAAEAKLDPQLVQFQPEIDGLVRLIEDTPRSELLEAVARKIHSGTSYREILAALLLAGVRNVRPRPSVGHKFHAVLVVNSAHLASLSSPDTDRWLPIFWALDYFKSSQADESRQSGWQMPPVDESAVPPAHKARAAFIEAMENWDEAALDAAVVSLARTAGATEVFELFSRYGGRDYRSIGHKAIFVANSSRTLDCIGWRYAEPVLRSLASALVNHSGEDNPSQSDHAADRPWRRNQELVKKIGAGWQGGQLNDDATRDLVAMFRTESSDAMCDKAVELLSQGVAAQSIWDAVLVASGELLMQQPAIVPLHAVTTSNAMRYAYNATGDDQTRRLLLLQNCAFLPMFRSSAKSRGGLKDLSIAELEPAALKESASAGAIEEIFADVSGNPLQAGRKIRTYLAQDDQGAKHVIDAARRLLFLKGNNAHDYKFSSAVLEDYYQVSPAWRDTFLATSVFNLRGSGDRDNRLVQRTRNALKAST
jgi:hypothetical protein